ncbi:MAG TPA: CDP-alcohol phosphatidyltransferase family protein [Pseudogracilibacillus sp.]|nr:CDP-alcohol phosphatidyltransferase family protein [Pseudogracilibacillus sp.]
MVTIYDIKPKFQALLRPIVDKFAKAGVTANQVTLAAMTLSLFTGLALVVFHEYTLILMIVPLVMFIRMALNAIDGMLAKEHHMKTSLGTILNELGDVVSDTFLFIPFVFFEGFPLAFIIAVIILSIISEMTGVLGEVIGASRRYDGPMGKSDRAFVFSVLAIIACFNVTNSLFYSIVFLIMTTLIVLNIFNRIQRALQELNEKGAA